MIVKDNKPKTLIQLWVSHDHKSVLRVKDKDGNTFHVKQKTRMGGFILEDTTGITLYINPTRSSPDWTKL
jgi:hypothetical protein